MKTAWSIGAALVLLAVPALADNHRGFYAGIGGGVVTGDARTPYDEAEMPVVEFSAGYKYNGLLGIEARLGAGLKDDRDISSDYFLAEREADDSLSEIEREVKTYSALYYRPEITNEVARLYGLLGYAELDTQVTRWQGNTGTEADDSLSGTSYGIGMGWFVNERLNFNIEYRQLVKTDDYRFETYTLQWDYRF